MAKKGKVKIEKGVPMPDKWSGNGSLPFEDMEAGDSFRYPGRAAARSYELVKRANVRLAPKKFAARLNKGAARIWRVE